MYLLNEQLGRGTDFPITKDIDSNGGNYLILADIFSKRQEEQLIGRVGRLNNNGAYRYIVYRHGEK